MELYFSLLRASRRAFFLATLVGVVSGAATVAMLVLIRALIRGDTSTLTVSAFVGVCLLSFGAGTLSKLILGSLTKKTLTNLTVRASRQILASPLRRLESLGKASLQAAILRDVPAVAQGLKTIPTTFASVALLAGCLIFLGLTSALVCLLVVVAIALDIGMQLAVTRKTQSRIQSGRDVQEKVMGQVEHLLEGIQELKIHHLRREAFISESLKSAFDADENQRGASQFLVSISSSWGRALVLIVVALAIVFLRDGDTIDDASTYTLVIAIMITMRPLMMLQQQIPLMHRAQTSLRSLRSLELDLAKVRDANDEIGNWPTDNWSNIQLLNVAFDYGRGDGESARLRPISVAFQRGEVVVLRGVSGSGKTTFAKLLAGLYEPDGGEIRVDGQAVSAEAREPYRQLFSVVLADCHLFPSPLGYGSPRVDERLRGLLRDLRLDEHVTVENGTYSTTKKLSHGQKKRLALVTALAEDRSFYIFDDWPSDQEPCFKDLFYSQIVSELRANNKTVLIISHNEQFFNLGDRTLTLNNGELQEEVPCQDSSFGVTPP